VLSRNNLYRNIALIVIFSLFFLPIPTSNLWWREAINGSHTVFFIILSFIIYYQVKIRIHISNVTIVYFYVLAIGMFLGIVIELLQVFVQREASLNDLYRNLFGIITGLCLITILNLKNIHRQKTKIVFFSLVGTVFLILGISPLIQLSWHYIERNKAFPVIVDFDASWSSSFIRFNNTEILKASNFSQKKNNNLHLIQFNEGTYPGISVIESVSDWSTYRKLRLIVFSKYEHDTSLVLRIHDKTHNNSFSDRFNKKLEIKPGLNNVEISLEKIRYGPVNRELDLTNIAGIILFSRNLEQRSWFEISNIYLE